MSVLRRRPAAVLGLLVVVLTVLTWRRWGNPAFDAGNELTVADLVAHGATPYHAVRYYYGPLGLYALALDFRLLGTSLSAAYLFGYIQTGAILLTFHVLARRWLDAGFAALATAVLAAIAFSGSIFGFILPYTNSATLGLLALLAVLLALASQRWMLAGVLVGVTALTRPDFAVFAAAAAGGALVGTLRAGGLDVLRRRAPAIVLPALAVAGLPLAVLTIAVGFHTLFLESLYPVDFVHVSGSHFLAADAPFTAASALRALVRLALYGGTLWLAVEVADRARPAGGGDHPRTLRPVLQAAALVAVAGVATILGSGGGALHPVFTEAKRGLIVMTWMPLLAVGALAAALRRCVRGGTPPLGGSWPADLALLATAAVCVLRMYDNFSTDVPATYYAAPVLLVAAIAHQHLSRRSSAALAVTRAALVLTGAVLVVHIGAHADLGFRHGDRSLVHSARGDYYAPSAAAGPLQSTLRYVDSHTRPGERILILPDDGGLHFLADRPPALRDLTYLPGSLYPVSAERRAVALLRRERPPLVVIGARRFDAYGFRGIGVDYDRTLMAYVNAAYRPVATFGDFGHPPATSEPSVAFRVLAP
jgi:Dolichyl-phosphate-mannose-protein mannosyltransferase